MSLVPVILNLANQKNFNNIVRLQESRRNIHNVIRPMYKKYAYFTFTYFIKIYNLKYYRPKLIIKWKKQTLKHSRMIDHRRRKMQKSNFI